MANRVSLQKQDALIRRMVAEGYLQKEIAAAVGTNRGSIGNYLREHGIHHAADRKRWSRHGFAGACERHHDTVVEMAEAGATMESIAAAVGTNMGRVRAYLTQHEIRRPEWRESSPEAHPMSRRTEGPQNPAWKGGRIQDKDGYILLWMPEHPGSNGHGYVREHRFVMEQTIGRPLLPEEVVDHRNDVRDDNRPENLRLFANNSEHLSATLKGRHSRASRGLPPSTRKKSGTSGQQSPVKTDHQPE